MKLLNKQIKSSVDDSLKLEEIRGIIRVFSKLFFIKNCLTFSATLYIFLGSLGFKPTLYIGYTFKEKKFYSHSWIEVNDVLLQKINSNVEQFNKIISIHYE